MKNKLYIAAIGMISPIGYNTQMTFHSVRAKISRYQLSEYENLQGDPITMACIPPGAMDYDWEIEQGSYYREQYDRIIRMTLMALQDEMLITKLNGINSALPMILGMPEPSEETKQIPHELLIKNIIKLSHHPIDIGQIKVVSKGRASGIQALILAHQYFNRATQSAASDFVLLGGSDSYKNIPILRQLDRRVLAPNNGDGFAPGESACYLLLTNNPEKALIKNNHVIALHFPGVGEEVGHLESEHPYLGEGLDQAFKLALKDFNGQKISHIYSSMNGEHFWTKEYGVALLRNSKYFDENACLEHPADCYGDIGAATGSMLIGLSALSLLRQKNNTANLVYSSSDSAPRAAVVVEKISLESALNNAAYSSTQKIQSSIYNR